MDQAQSERDTKFSGIPKVWFRGLLLFEGVNGTNKPKTKVVLGVTNQKIAYRLYKLATTLTLNIKSEVI